MSDVGVQRCRFRVPQGRENSPSGWQNAEKLLRARAAGCTSCYDAGKQIPRNSQRRYHLKFTTALRLCHVLAFVLVAVISSYSQASKPDSSEPTSIATKGAVKVSKKNGTSYFHIDVNKAPKGKKLSKTIQTYKIDGPYSIDTDGVIRKTSKSGQTMLEVFSSTELKARHPDLKVPAPDCAPCSLQGNATTGTYCCGFCNYPQSCVHHLDAHNDFCSCDPHP